VDEKILFSRIIKVSPVEINKLYIESRPTVGLETCGWAALAFG
jgi:hypothetical protein